MWMDGKVDRQAGGQSVGRVGGGVVMLVGGRMGGRVVWGGRVGIGRAGGWVGAVGIGQAGRWVVVVGIGRAGRWGVVVGIRRTGGWTTSRPMISSLTSPWSIRSGGCSVVRKCHRRVASLQSVLNGPSCAPRQDQGLGRARIRERALAETQVLELWCGARALASALASAAEEFLSRKGKEQARGGWWIQVKRGMGPTYYAHLFVNLIRSTRLLFVNLIRSTRRNACSKSRSAFCTQPVKRSRRICFCLLILCVSL